MNINQFLILFTNIVLVLGGVVLLILSLVLFIECVAAFFSSVKPSSHLEASNKKVTVLIPAHNEEAVIGNTIKHLQSQLIKQHQLVIIADNCTDATADIAREFGTQVIERHDLQNRGKGYALDYGLQFLESDPPDVVVFVDADCIVSPGAIESLSQCAIATNRPVQATYLIAKPNTSNPKQSVSAFAFTVKNQVRLLGLAKFGIPCLLTGTGMAFPWAVIRSVDLASGYIVEDMKLGFDLAIAGYSPVFCPEAHVTSILPQHIQAAKSQRTRWEHGHLKTLLTYVPMLIQASVKQRRLDLFLSALDLCVPPLSLLIAIWSLLMVLSLIFAISVGIWISATVLAATGLFLLSAILIAWTKFGRNDLPLLQLLAIPIYILWKIPLYLQFLLRPQNRWIRTERDSVNVSKP
ncbi:glycosyltransferase [Nostoc sp. FACHB-152]|uniref:glycosyltransferase family 2 protein n=1 Tax=unclassified Nostoc TaxID=2593658 RepID=UPI00168432B0|nr:MULTISPECIES: glycosyltransferase [unclassified Nostoc]MBD2451211.1 glycosyltransferase [Nostoc sp. FACHB-152]MBD2472223.1 glycosyltransferase [Nostoc sp. FACHB-145]